MKMKLEKYAHDSEFYERLAIDKAKEEIARSMERHDVSKAELASMLGTSRSAVTKMLADERNMTLKSLGRILYTLGDELFLTTKPIVGRANDSSK